MASNAKGRSGFGASSTRFSLFGNTSGSGRTSSSKKTNKKSTGAMTPAGYKNCCKMFQGKIQSFKVLANQTTGTAKCGRPTPSTLNTFANWINKGAIIQTCSPTQVAKWAATANKNFNTRSATPASCKTVLCAKFGKTAIKAVTKSKTGAFLVATSATKKGRAFCFPK